MQIITTPAIRTNPVSRTTPQTQQPPRVSPEVVVSCSKIEAILLENFANVFEHIDDEYEPYLNTMRNVLELVLSNNSVKLISSTIKKVWYQSLLKSNSDIQVCGLYKILSWILKYTKSNAQHKEFYKYLIADFYPDFFRTTNSYVNQIGTDRFGDFNTDWLDVSVMLDGRSPASQSSNVRLKQIPVKNESTRIVKDEKSKIVKDEKVKPVRSEPSRIKDEKVTLTTPQYSVKSEKIPSVKSAFTSNPVKAEKIQPTKTEKTATKPPPPQPKTEKTAPKPPPQKIIPQVKPEKIASSSKAPPMKSERLNTSTSSSVISSPSKPKIKPATPKNQLITNSQKNQPQSTSTDRKAPSLRSPAKATPSSPEESPTKKRERKWRKEHNDKLMDYFSKRPHLANNTFFESDALMRDFIESYDFAISLTIPTLAKRKYKYDQFFQAIMAATQTVIKPEKNTSNKRKDPPSSSSNAKRHKM